jgi:hypothetical protein
MILSFFFLFIFHSLEPRPCVPLLCFAKTVADYKINNMAAAPLPAPSDNFANFQHALRGFQFAC